MKKILFAFSFISLFLTGCSDPKPEDPKSDATIKNETKKESIKAATDIVYQLSDYLYKDDLNKGVSKNIDADTLKILDDNFKEFNKKTETDIENRAELLGIKPLSSVASEQIIKKYLVKMKVSETVLNIVDLNKNITTELEKNRTSRADDKVYLSFKDDIILIKNDLESIIKKNKDENDKAYERYKNWEENNPKSSIPTWLYTILAILFALLVAAIYFIKMIFDSLERLKIKRDNDKQKFNDLKYNHDRLNNKVAVINIDAVRDEMYEQMNILAGRINDTQSEQVRDIRSTSQAKPEPKIFYAQYPDSADPVGFKNIQFESNSKMVYRITRIEGNKARFIIQPDENTQQYAIGNHGKILKPVCEYLNQPSSMNRTIKVFREGRLEMQNNIWIVVEKLKIKFE